MSSEKKRTAAFARLGEVLEAYQAAVDDFDREVARLLDVNETDLRCLEILIQDDPDVATPRLLADRLGLTTGSVTTMLDRLEKRGYVTRAAHPTDRRKVVVHATDAVTARVFALLGPMLSDGERKLLPRYDIDQLELIIDFLVRAEELQHVHLRRLRTL